jgi:hypothetical protein
MKKHFSKRRVVLLAILAVALGIGAGAYAYFTASGSGEGTAGVGNATTIDLVGTVTGTLYPAGDPAGVSVLVTNNGEGAQLVGSVHLASIDPDAGHPLCDTSVSGANPAFTMADIAVGAPALAPGADTTVTGSLQMNDTGVSQNNCQGATLTLNLTSN